MMSRFSEELRKHELISISALFEAVKVISTDEQWAANGKESESDVEALWILHVGGQLVDTNSVWWVDSQSFSSAFQLALLLCGDRLEPGSLGISEIKNVQ